MSEKKIADSYSEAECLLRMVIYGNCKELGGYQSAKQVLAFLKRKEVKTECAYYENKIEAFKVALSKVAGVHYLKNCVVTRIQTEEDVELSIKELLRASGIMSSSVDEFILALIED